MPKILVLSSNTPFATDLKEQIGLYVPEFELVEEAPVDVVVIDENEDILQEWLRSELKKPIIFLTSTNHDDMSGVRQINKPFELSSFLDVVRASISLFENSAEGELEFNNYVLYPQRKEILNCRNNELIKLTEKEVAIIKYLYRNQNQIVSKNDLLQEVWQYAADATTHTVETHIYRLRQKVENGNSAAQLIQTNDGGYQLIM